MMSMIAALSIGGYWKIHDPDSIKSSFPNFLDLIKKLKKHENNQYTVKNSQKIK